jgi:hypothetical protein
MKIFGVSIITIILVVVAYYAGMKGWLSAVTSKIPKVGS